MSSVVIDGVARQFDNHRALNDVSITIEQGEFFSLLGPSGCGKTTLLNIIAGFLSPNNGRVLIGGKDVTALPPYQRHIGMVFQNYALFPHLSVGDNVAFGLKVRKVSRGEQQRRVTEALKQVRLDGLAQRMPHQLSGGQQQRVAIARALAIQPQVLLLDEPLSNLDARLRKEMQDELRALQQRVGITTILVTHDQEEALTLSDRIGILGQGELQQIGSPAALYRQPSNRFVAEFVGQANLFHVTAQNGLYHARDHFVAAGAGLQLAATQPATVSSLLIVRPERVQFSTEPQQLASNGSVANVKEVSFAGATLRLLCLLPGGGEIRVQPAEAHFSQLPAPGDRCYLYWQAADVIVLPAQERA
ncbi:MULTISPECIES: ABC transporter ATP-binding protein [unclassified Pantoea]|uniref:ABC transporter ATP-binding protein n=1 Tax=unclassified Pantoea TaxID=2630326 RepID=UPI001CD1D456|nr:MULTISPECIES: ABC transporter ATP-binding protein [unclassified Pantoea]MCA1179728.1 ABC transporter ATP-binding protein [Pantoea sp. alder69]MCA1252323.1 ABC transporter ATP-binding protein [Pantoea sp. alder70]MCA1268071.1 ABC transporter ATP-binding protein [Pantoea sp. alder81]